MTRPESPAGLLGAQVRVGTIRIGEVVGVFYDEEGRRAIGLEVASVGGTRRFLPWVAARWDCGAVAVDSALVIVDDGGSYERRGARLLRDPAAIRALSCGEVVDDVPVSDEVFSGIGHR